ncbi:hypothetical protein LTR49_027370 [Elasticomyces elasticus]|nr:hypothetical protein LTR49_027370 [Elasticomyces elasticus]
MLVIALTTRQRCSCRRRSVRTRPYASLHDIHVHLVDHRLRSIACWTWNPHGWIFKLGGLDFAGGTLFHISSGAAALAYSYVLGKRTGFGTNALNFRPHNTTQIVIGTVFLWVGWFGFDAGSALSANMRAIMAAVVTNLAACVGGVTWCLMDYRLERKWSTVGFCSGVIAGLVAITPGSGYVPAWAAVVFGVCAGIGCNFATQFKYWIQVDDGLDIFAGHGIGGGSAGIDDVELGEFAYDYVELTRDVKPRDPPHDVSQIDFDDDEEVGDRESQRSHSQAETVKKLELRGGAFAQ